MDMLNITREDQKARLLLGENLVASFVLEVREEMKLLVIDGVTELIIDLSAVDIVDSAGIGCLVAAHNSLLQKGGRLVVENVSDDIFDLFRSMRLNRHFPIARSD
jgi:anti-anti-sigma factor